MSVPAREKFFWILMITIAGAVAVATTVASVLSSSQRRERAAEALAPDPNMDLLTVPEFTLTDQNGRAVSRGDLLGRLTVVDFFFTRCPLACPPMTTNMRSAQESLAGTGVRFLSVSVDPAHDGPSEMRAHAERHGADLATWSFLSGDPEVCRGLAKQMLLFDVAPEKGRIIQAIGGGEMENIQHPSKFVLVGPDAKIIALYDGLRAEEVGLLVERARLASSALRKR